MIQVEKAFFSGLRSNFVHRQQQNWNGTLSTQLAIQGTCECIKNWKIQQRKAKQYTSSATQITQLRKVVSPDFT